MKAFIVIENGGEYEDSYSSILAVFLNKDLAEAYKENKYAEYEKQDKESYAQLRICKKCVNGGYKDKCEKFKSTFSIYPVCESATMYYHDDNPCLDIEEYEIMEKMEGLND